MSDTTALTNLMDSLSDDSLVEESRLGELLADVTEELDGLQPAIDELETMLAQLDDLKRRKQRLIAFKLSLETLMRPAAEVDAANNAAPVGVYGKTVASASAPTPQALNLSELRLKAFYPDEAFAATESLLPRKESINYELFKAIVLNGGKASTEDIKAYLLENNIVSPTTGEGFEEVGLSQISSRVNYLMRKNIVSSLGGGMFVSNYGWGNPS